MKSGNLLLGLVACAAMCACTDNDLPNTGGTNSSQVFAGDVAYMAVNITDVGSTTTKSTIDDGYIVGNDDEHAIKNIYFYFYDSNGNLETYTDATTTWTDARNTYADVELSGTKVVMLSGLADKTFPAYMVTLINKPDDFTVPSTLAELDGKLASASDTDTGIKTSDGYFTMSSCSYFFDFAEDNEFYDSYPAHDNESPYYFTSKVSASDFSTEPIDESAVDYLENPVKVAVERLGVRVTLYPSGLGTNLDSDNGADEEDDGLFCFHYYYDYVDDEVNGTDYESRHFYEIITGWGLNGTEKQSYMMKKIKSLDDWPNNADDFFVWNVANAQRSYWGMSPHYGVAHDYPTTAEGLVLANEPLNYITANDLTIPFKDTYYAYCAENTNTAGSYADGTKGILQNKNSSAITSILAKSKIYIVTDETLTGSRLVDVNAEIERLGDCVRCDDKLYTFNAYLAYAAGHIFSVYVEDPDNTGEYIPIDKSYLEVNTKAYDGYVKVYLKDDYKNTTFYSDSEGTTELSYDDVNEIMDTNFNDNFGSEACGIMAGISYYNIPIEHLNQNTAADGGIVEANYGVVRDHYYYVAVNSIKGPGWGITNPDEPIIPQIESDKYGIEAEVNINSWKKVDKEVAF